PLPPALRIAHSGRDVHGERLSHSSVRRGRGKPRHRSEPSGLPASFWTRTAGILSEVRGEHAHGCRLADWSKTPSAKGAAVSCGRRSGMRRRAPLETLSIQGCWETSRAGFLKPRRQIAYAQTERIVGEVADRRTPSRMLRQSSRNDECIG